MALARRGGDRVMLDAVLWLSILVGALPLLVWMARRVANHSLGLRPLYVPSRRARRRQ